MKMSSSDSEYEEGPNFYSLMEGKLTVEKATAALDIIKGELDDCEAAHSYEKTLMATFVRQIADGSIADMATIKAIADIIQQVSALKFPRYFA